MFLGQTCRKLFYIGEVLPHAESMRLDTKKIRRIKQCYSGLGLLEKALPRHVDLYHCNHWRNGVMSPNFLAKKTISTDDLSALEKYFQKNKVKGPYETNTPRFAILQDSYYDRKRIEKQIKKKSWTKLSGSNETINVWENPLPISLPKGYFFKVGRYFDKSVYKDFVRMMNEGFGRDKKFQNELDKMHRVIEENLLTVVIYNSKSKPVGAGLVVTGKDRASYLYCDAISKKYRRRGLWKLLVAIRQSVSNSGPGHIWAMTTFNPNIMNQGDFSRKIVRYYKEIDVT